MVHGRRTKYVDCTSVLVSSGSHHGGHVQFQQEGRSACEAWGWRLSLGVDELGGGVLGTVR